MRDAAPRARSGNLTAALAAFATLELAVNRLANRLFLPQSTVSGDSAGVRRSHLLAASGPLLFHFTGVLALVVLVAALAGLLRRGELFPRGTRLVVALFGAIFGGLVALSLVVGAIPAGFFMYARLAFAFLSMFIAGGALVSGCKPRVKLGVALFAAPGVLHVFAVFVDHGLSLAASSDVLAVLTHARDLTAVAACVGAPFLLPPRPARERPRGRAAFVAALATLGFGSLFATRYDLLAAAFLYGWRVELPPSGALLGLSIVAAFAGWSFATVQLLVDKGGMRLAGLGLLLLAVAGPQGSSPVELSLGLVGLLGLAVGELRAIPYGEPTRTRVSGEAWRAYVGRLATAAGDGTSPDDSRSEGLVVEEGELEVTRIRAHRRGLPVAMRLLRRRGALVELEATVGEPARTGPDARIERHRRWLARGPEQRASLPRARTGDATFDQRFSVHGAAPLADAALRRRLLRQPGDGIVSLWRGAAARYHATNGAAGEDPAPFTGDVEGDTPVLNLVAVLDTLADLVEASA
ncbi:MAG: hypothetical protein JWM82_4508 [Myxococcales bacterium]|nr:hypothetical protein [Myxococcales bacterium]